MAQKRHTMTFNNAFKEINCSRLILYQEMELWTVKTRSIVQQCTLHNAHISSTKWKKCFFLCFFVVGVAVVAPRATHQNACCACKDWNKWKCFDAIKMRHFFFSYIFHLFTSERNKCSRFTQMANDRKENGVLYAQQAAAATSL